MSSPELLDLLLVAAARRHPNRVAVRLAGDTPDRPSLTYRELDERSAVLADRLRRHAAGPDVPVAVCLPRGPGLLVALLGVLRAGAGYLPIDPDYPAARRSYMLADSGAPLQITAGDATSSGPVTVAIDPITGLVTGGPPPADEPAAPPARHPLDMAYLIYTSGSTGQPKGVVVPHAAVTAFLAAMLDRPGITADTVLLAVTTVCFDISVLELFGPLLAGGRVELATREDAGDAERIAAAMAAAHVTTMQATPATWRMLRLQGWTAPAGFTILCGGERLPADLAGWFGGGAATAWDLYGPTESTVWATTARLGADGAVQDWQPVTGTTVHVLDAAGRPVPDGATGEIYLGGAGPARGYHDRPVATAERFLPDPAGAPGSRLYRTGDRGKRRPDGAVEILGRLDQQLKIRGHRVEPGEVEAVAGELPGVRHAVAQPVPDAAGQLNLALYVVPQPGTALDLGALRAALATELPEYLVPTWIRSLDALPLTLNGKVDRAALPDPAPQRTTVAEPRTSTEKALADVWAELLRIPGAGPDDDFVALGGHSLLAATLTARIREIWDVALPMGSLLRHPTLAAQAARIDERLAAPAHAPVAARPAPDTGGDLPLTAGQRRIWFVEQIHSNGLPHTTLSAYRLRGDLDIAALTTAVQAVADRHDVLRACFPTVDGQPVQRLRPDLTIPVEVTESPVKDRFDAEIAKSFDLERGPLMSVLVVRVAPDEHVVLFRWHHIIFDGWSQGVFLHDLAVAYQAGRDGLAPLPVAYPDAVLRRDGEGAEAGLDYWRQQLAGAPELSALPTDHPRRATQSSRGGQVRRAVPATVAARFRELCTEQAVTPYTGLLAVFALLLARHSGEDDVVVGSPVADRDHPGDEALIGLFLNTLVLRVDTGGDPTLSELFTRTRNVVLGALEHQDVPFERVVEALAAARQLGHNPLFQILFNVEGAEAGTLDLPGLTAEPVDVDVDGSRFDLVVAVRDTAGGGLRVEAEYATDLFEPATAERLVEHYIALLEAATAHAPADRIGDLALPVDADRARIAAWNSTAAPVGRTTMADLIGDTPPDTIAVSDPRTRLTYRELGERADRLAGHLAALGARPGELIGLYLPRDARLAVGLLGAMRSGAGYVPLDPAYPAGRLAAIVRRTGLRIVVSGGVPPMPVPTVVTLDADGTLPGDVPLGTPLPAGPDDIAYVIHTSGSTGEPKGVALPHRALVNLTRWQFRDHLSGVRTGQISAIGFDLHVDDVLMPLISGGEVAFPPDGTATDPELLHAWLDRTGVAQIICTPSLFDQLARVSRQRDTAPSALREVIVAGEQLTVTPAIRWLLERGSIALSNHYGPAETHVVTAFPCAPDGLPHRPPIGRPIDNTQVHVLDSRLRPVPVGVPGELYLAGVGVADGYRNRPGLTADRFLPDPFAARPGARMYRTGDVGRWLPSGDVEYRGRADDQVKLRGVRIEPAEIEARLAEHPRVRQAAVAVHGPALVAYLVTDGETPASADLRELLGRSLPGYMVPQIYVPLDELPRTSSGKIARRMLPAPETTAPDRSTDREPPRTEVERAIAAIWSELLGVARIGRTDNFFELGGHSLLATMVLSRLRARFPVEITVPDLFTAPHLAALAELVGQRRMNELAEAPDVPLTPVDRRDGAPLSFAQQRLWMLDQLNPGGTEYLLDAVWRLRGPLEAERMRDALDTVVARHEILRTRYPVVDSEPVQRIDPATPGQVPLTAVDLRGASPERLDELLTEQSRHPIDLATGPVLRALLIRTGEQEHVLALVVHHIAGDGWSIAVLEKELDAAYRSAELPPPTVQYGDFAAWQRDRLAGPALDRQLDFWRQRLADLPQMDLPTDRPRPPVRDGAGDTYRFVVPAGPARRLVEIGRARRATPFTVYLSAFATLLSRYCGQSDVVVGVPVAGRTPVEVEDLIGFFVNTLVMPVDLAGAASFPELLDRVQADSLAAFAHQDVPFDRLVADLGVERTAARNPLFQVLFALRPADQPAERIGPLEAERRPVTWRTAKFDLTLDLTEQPDGSLSAELEFAVALFDRDTVERIAAHFVHLVELLATNPQTRPEQAELITADDRRMLASWRRPAVPRPDRTLPELIAAQAAATPDAVAVVDPAGELSFAELLGGAHQLAHHLRNYDVRPEAVTAVCLPRSARTVTALLAVVSAGGAYLPLDPEHPPTRLADCLADAGAEVVLTERRFDDRLPDGVRRVYLDELNLSRYPVTAPDVSLHPGDLLYALYTSGSTGRPKAATVTHRGMVNRVLWAASAHRIGAGDRVLQKTPMTFDAAGWEVWAPLALGGTVVLPDPGVERDSAALLRAVAASGATVLQVVPSLLGLLVESPEFGAATSLRLICAGGEQLTERLCRQVLNQLDVELHNLYGPTECTIDAVTWRYRPGAAGRRIPIGTPLDNVEAHVLDPAGRRVPSGVAGELYLGGAGLGRGYLGRPGLTADRFVPDPFGSVPGARLYRTGDRVLRRPDGMLEFLGRMDDQVKIGGVRIEPGEIEAVLAGHPAVTAAAVVPRVDSYGDRYLVGYVEPATADPETVLAHAASHLPAALVPARLMVLDRLPRTDSGKIDRRSLPAAPVPEQAGTTPPATDTERAVAAIFAEVLGRPVGATDDFFRLGGHSLLAIRAAVRLRAVGLEVAPRLVFTAPTVRLLSRLIDDRPAVGADRAIRRVPRTGPLPASSGQRRLWFLDRLRPGQREYLVPVALRIRGPLDPDRLAGALTAMVARHEVLRTRYEMRDGDLNQVIEPPAAVPMPVTELSGPPEVTDFVDRVSRRPFRLDADPALRAHLGRVTENDHILVLSMPHIATDAWSMRVIAAELHAGYASAGRPDLQVQFADYAAWERDWLTGGEAAEQLDWWRERLAGLVPLDLPADHPRDPGADPTGGSVTFEVPPRLAGTVLRLGRERGATPFMTMLAVFLLVLARRTGRLDLAVGTTVAGRRHAEVEHLIGCFINSVVLRTDLPPAGTFPEVLDRVRESSLDAFARQDLPFEQLVNALRPARDPGRNPLFQVLFELDTPAGTQVTLPGLDTEPVAPGWRPAKLDLTLHLDERDDGGYSGDLEFATALFEPATVRGIAADFLDLLARVADQPQEPLVIPAAGSVQVAPTATELAATELAATELAATEEYVPPRTAAEQMVATIWAEVLEVGQVGATDDFFALGGHSLLAGDVQLQLQESLDIELPLRTLFEKAVLADLAGEVERIITAEANTVNVSP